MTALTNLDYYKILGVSSRASDAEIRKAYKKKALSSHPDKASQNNLSAEKATELFKQVQEAYATLSHPQKRILYDKSRNILHDRPVNFTTFFFHERLFSFRRNHNFGSNDRYQRKNDVECEAAFSPQWPTQEVDHIIASNSSEMLDQFLKSKPFENALLKSIFYFACLKGKFNIVKYLIEEKKLNPNLKVDHGLWFTGPIFKAAAESGNLELVKYLLEVHHVDIESQGLTPGTCDTALSRAAENGHVDVVEYLISKGANLNAEVARSDILGRAMKSKKLSIVKLLAEAGTKINNSNLSQALESGYLDIVQYLLKKSTDTKVYLHTSYAACDAVKSGNVSLVKYLEEKEGFDIFERKYPWSDDLNSLLKAAAESGSVEMMKFLLDERGLNEKVLNSPSYIQTILSNALRCNPWAPISSKEQDALKFMKFLMEERKFALEKEKLQWLIADSASLFGIKINSYLQSYLYDSDQWKKDILRAISTEGLESSTLSDLFKIYNLKLIKKGRYDDFCDEIHLHIKERHLSIEQLRQSFLENRSMMVDALLYYSNYYYKEDLSVLNLLLELGVDLNSEDAEGEAAIHVALRSGGRNKIVQFFIDNKADLSKKNKHGQTAAEILRYSV